MRKNELRRTANAQLNRDKSGSPRDQKHRLFVMNKVIHDLFKLKQCPPTWYGLTQNHILALVHHWKKQKITSVTMMKYMTCIRYFLRTLDQRVDNIDNQTLKLSRTTRPLSRISISSDRLHHPLSKLIFEFQSDFGLTFSETIRLIPDLHLREHALWLTREITFNSQDRVIPLRDEKQHLILQTLRELTGDANNLITAYGYHAVLAMYRTEMQRAGLNSRRSYRSLYAKHLLLKDASSAIIMREMGLKSRSTLWNYLRE